MTDRVSAPSIGDRPDGHALYALARELYPICRSITGNGVRQTLRRLADFVPLDIHEVPSGTPVLDWTVPLEWNINEAWIASLGGERLVDLRDSSLHVLNYSRGVRARVRREDLESHLHSLPDHPDWIPYRTSYYLDTWGFCLTHRQRTQLTDAEYDVLIDSTLAPGSLTYGECVIPGRSREEVLFSAHVCHPSLANDNLSGIVALIGVIQELVRSRPRYTYRVLFAPGTIGAITWLARNEVHLERVRHGLVVTCLGDAGAFTYKRSRRGNADIDRIVEHVLRQSNERPQVRDFSPDGYDERQYCSPGFNLPVGRLTRTPNGEYPEYHTSADNLDLIQPASLEASVLLLLEIVAVLEGNETLLNRLPKGEPHLGRRGLYPSLGGTTDSRPIERALLWVLNFSDGEHSLLDIAERSGLSFPAVRSAGNLLLHHNLLDLVDARD